MFRKGAWPSPPAFPWFVGDCPAAPVGLLEEIGCSWLAPFSNASKLGLGARPVAQVTRRAIRFWIRRFLKIKNAIAHAASRTSVMMAATAPPERPGDFFAPPTEPARTESVGEVIAAIEEPATPGWTGLDVSCDGVLEVGTCGDDGGCSDGDEDEAMMSEVFMLVGRVELSPMPEADAFGATIVVTSDVETRTTVVGVGVSPMPEAGT
jgi:hypothetical protein